jgi:hypothetical protein
VTDSQRIDNLSSKVDALIVAKAGFIHELGQMHGGIHKMLLSKIAELEERIEALERPVQP